MPARKDPSLSYEKYKQFEGRRYTGMAVGRRHRWHYDRGEWKERKLTPDKWEFTFDVVKRRAGKAPEGSGVPVGTEYHWYIMAHQNARKLNANDYTTAMAGLKFKIAHKRADRESWSASPGAQRRRLIGILEEMLAQLKAEDAGPEAAKVAGAKPPVVRPKAAARRTDPRRKRIRAPVPARASKRAVSAPAD